MLRRRIMLAQGGVSLPAGYTKIEYLESDGSQFIDTGYKPNNNTRVVMDAMVTDGNQDWIALFGAREADYTNCFSCFATGSTNPTPNKLYPNIGDIFDVEYLDVDIYSRHKYDVNKNVVSVDGVVLHTFTARTFTNSLNIFLFSNNDAGSPSFQHKVRVWACKIYDNGVLVRDLIPCTNSDGISGLWDSVNDVFYKLLPADYTRLDFIETDGTTYIDTGYKPNNNTRVIFEGYNNNANSKWLFGTWNASGSGQFGISMQNGAGVRYGSQKATITNQNVGDVYGELNKAAYNFNGTTGTLSAETFSCSYNLFIGALNQAGTPTDSSYGFIGRIYSVKIWDNGTLVRDFIPAMNASGEAGLYDLKNDVWYALLPVAKPKVENKISLTLYATAVVAISQNSVASTISVAVRIKGYFEDMNGILQPVDYTFTLTIVEGALRSNIGMGFNPDMNYTITSISPTEDDTYIYTF